MRSVSVADMSSPDYTISTTDIGLGFVTLGKAG
jgi:hypothetical protein